MDISTLTQKLEISANGLFAKVMSSVDRQDIERVGKVVTISYAAYLITSKLYVAFLGPLSGIPGPLGLKFYDMRYTPNIENPPGTSWEKVLAWRKEYGNVARLGPNRIAISDKRMLRQIALQDDMPKGPMYTAFLRKSPPTLFNTREKPFHKQRRRLISPAFSVKYINSLEKYMLSTAESFVRRIDRDIEATQDQNGYGLVDIWILLRHLALDIIGETAFGKTFHMLENDDHLVPRTVKQNMEKTSFLMTHPILGKIFLALPFTGVLKANDDLKMFMKDIIIERLTGGEKARRNDILQILIDTQSASDTEDRLAAETIAQETVLFLMAGSETTSNGMGFALIELMKNKRVFSELRKEIDSVQLKEGQELLEENQLKHLPYLNAVINESMRLNSIVAIGIERMPDEDTVLDGRLLVPKGTILHCNFYHAQIDPVYWPRAEEFIPERWLEGSDIPADTEAFFPFSIGSRNCIGKGFALQEMRLALGNLVKLYDFEAIAKELSSANERRAFGTLGLKSSSFKVMMKRRTAN
ncbi:cytochrome P450 [Fennellomyces sp. T-0311]|nr:cytochrome P450 [Fennellomyces sp. T-0311]